LVGHGKISMPVVDRRAPDSADGATAAPTVFPDLATAPLRIEQIGDTGFLCDDQRVSTIRQRHEHG
jgi:hypothetical protein